MCFGYYSKKAVESIKQYGFIETIKCIPLVIKKRLHIFPYEKPYDSTYEDDAYKEEKDIDTEIKAIAFYLPQYHSIPENDKWWGEGFTEWTNTKKATPKYKGHYQPRIPHKDIGYYKLDDIETIKKQVKIAKAHGVYGFCFYYYWFSGKRLLEKPLDLLLEHKEIQMPFCICWANENWTRTWSGNKEDILIQQEYKKDDPDLFIQDAAKYIADERYIKIGEKPLIIVYNSMEIPDCESLFEKWRALARKNGIGEIEIWACYTDNSITEKLLKEGHINAVVDFPPRNSGCEDKIYVKHLSDGKDEICIYDYRMLVKSYLARYKKWSNFSNHYPTCMMAWDNSPRKEVGWHSFYGFSQKWFYKWLKGMISLSRKHFDIDHRYLFINAWNEWGEGTYLEPDEKYGYVNINTFSEALLKK